MAQKTVSKDNGPDDGSSGTPAGACRPLRVRSLLVAGLLVAMVLLGFGVFSLRPCRLDAEQFITVSSGQSLSAVSHTLYTHGLITHPLPFRALARWRGDARRIQAGSYRFAPGSYRPGDVLRILVEGRVELISCTIPEGLTAQEVVKRCSDAGIGDYQRYEVLLTDKKFLQHLKIPMVEGYLFPETYRFAPGISESSVLSTMVQQMRHYLDTSLLTAAKEQGLNELQLLTLASIIQKEAGNREEMPLISAVFHNRLKRGMLLQADPTVIYGLGEFDGNLTRQHLRTPTPYNTYVHRGLPPGPIANPGLDALKAAVLPADESYLYFVATGAGGHYFSNTLQEHNRAVRRYQLHR